VLLHNWHLKLTALGLAILLWALVQTEPVSEETLAAVPVTIEVLDSAWTIARAPSPATVTLTLGGPAREIIRLAREGPILRVPVSAVGARDSVIALQTDWVDVGQRSGVTVESVSPRTITVTFEPAVARNLRLWAPLRGRLPADLALSSPLAFSPTAVEVRGAESRMRGRDSIPLVPLDLEAIRESGALMLGVDTTGLGGASIHPASVLVGVRVEPLVVRLLEGVEVSADVPSGEPRAVATPATMQLRLEGASTLVTSLDLTMVSVVVAPDALRNLAPGEVRRVPVRVEGLPPLIQAYPESDAVTVRRAGGQ
jgi:hypothetical protein